MRIDPENRVAQGLTGFLSLRRAQLLYLLLCLPIVTIGAATSALYEVMIRFSDDERGRPLKDFFPAFRRNFVRATLVALCLLPPVVLLAFSSVFWFSQDSVAVAASPPRSRSLGAVYLFAAFLYGMAQVALLPGRRPADPQELAAAAPGRAGAHARHPALPRHGGGSDDRVPAVRDPAADRRLLGRRLRDGLPLPQRLRPPPGPEQPVGRTAATTETGTRDRSADAGIRAREGRRMQASGALPS